uniref:C2H2-type domain-containing protein n=1 Tax=Heterorhabditis bacteriophora TaxID=37862 RepID=A0A1I7X0B6_HETBA
MLESNKLVLKHLNGEISSPLLNTPSPVKKKVKVDFKQENQEIQESCSLTEDTCSLNISSDNNVVSRSNNSSTVSRKEKLHPLVPCRNHRIAEKEFQWIICHLPNRGSFMLLISLVLISEVFMYISRLHKAFLYLDTYLKRPKKSSTKSNWNNQQTVYASCCNNKNCPYAALSSTDNVIEEPRVQRRRQTKEKSQELKKKRVPQTIARLLQGSQPLPQRHFMDMQFPNQQTQYANMHSDNIKKQKEQENSDLHPLNLHSTTHFPMQEKSFSEMNLAVEKSERPIIDEQMKDLVKKPSSHLSLLAQKQFLSSPLMQQQNINMKSFYESPLQQHVSPVEKRDQEQVMNFSQSINHSHQPKYRHGSEVPQFVLSQQQIPSLNQLNHNKQWLVGDRLNSQSLDQQIFTHKPHLIGRQKQLYKSPLDEGLQPVPVASECIYCPICGEILKENQSIDQHMQLEHLGDGNRRHPVLVQPPGFQPRHDKLAVLHQQSNFGFGQEKHQVPLNIWQRSGREFSREQQVQGHMRLESNLQEQENQPKEEQLSSRKHSPSQLQNYEKQCTTKLDGQLLSSLDRLDSNQNTKDLYLQIMKDVQKNEVHNLTGPSTSQSFPSAEEFSRWVSIIAKRLMAKTTMDSTEESTNQVKSAGAEQDPHISDDPTPSH